MFGTVAFVLPGEDGRREFLSGYFLAFFLAVFFFAAFFATFFFAAFFFAIRYHLLSGLKWFCEENIIYSLLHAT